MLPLQQALLARLLQIEILAQGNELHLGRDDATPRMAELGDIAAGSGTARQRWLREAQLRSLEVVLPLPGVA
jgi:hypothetical protein